MRYIVTGSGGEDLIFQLELLGPFAHLGQFGFLGVLVNDA